MDGQEAAYRSRKQSRVRKRTVRNVTVAVMLFLVLVGLFAVKIFVVPQSEIRNMDYIELSDDRRITITADNCSYDAGGILKWSPEDGVLVMRDGERLAVSYDAMYGVFMIKDRYSGCYHLE